MLDYKDDEKGVNEMCETVEKLHLEIFKLTKQPPFTKKRAAGDEEKQSSIIKGAKCD